MEQITRNDQKPSDVIASILHGMITENFVELNAKQITMYIPYVVETAKVRHKTDYKRLIREAGTDHLRKLTFFLFNGLKDKNTKITKMFNTLSRNVIKDIGNELLARVEQRGENDTGTDISAGTSSALQTEIPQEGSIIN